MWFRRFRSKRSPRKLRHKPTLERLEDRTVPTATWNNFGGDAQHTDVAQVAAQPINQLLWQMPLDLAPWGDVHYGDPVFTANNVVVVPLKVTWGANNQNATNFIEVGMNDVTGTVLWSTAPMGSITGASNVGSTIVITTNNTNGLANGDSVTIGDMLGDTAANTGSSNKTYTVSNVTSTSFTLNGVTGNGTYTSGGLWVLSTTSSAATSYIEPKYSWLPPDQAAYDPITDRVYFPGPGGTIDYISNPDTATGVVTPVQEAFYGYANYTNNPTAYDASIYINTPVTVDAQGNVYFGYAITGSNPSSITKGGIARISSSGTATNVTAFAAADTAGQTPSDDGNWVAALGSAPALSNDGSTVYFAVDDGGYGLSGGEYDAYLVGLNSSTLQPEYSVRLYDPTTGNGVPATGVQTKGNGAGVIDQSTASPMVAPDGTVYMGVFGSSYDGSRGSLLHFSGNLQTEYIPGAFGWDDTPSVVPTSMVPSYTGSSSYLILSKYNNYANAETGSSGGNGVNEIAVLDPYASQPDPNNDPEPNGQPMPVMKQVLAIASPSPDIDNINGGDPDAVREWCTNGTAIDPLDDSIFVNNEDGYTYEWDLGTDTITNTVEVSQGYGVPYTPTAISPNGEVFSDNGGTLFSLGGYSNYTIATVSSANPAVYGTPFTLTTTLASTSGGPTPTGTITYTAYAGANNPLNYDTTPIALGNATINASGVATLTISGTQLLAAHYHIIASYSGETNTYSAGQATIVLPVLETATTTVSASPNPVAKGASATFMATVTPNGTPSTVVQNGTGSSSYFVPIGAVTFMDGSTVLGTVNLNPLESGGPNGNGTYPSSYIQQVAFTTSSLPVGTDAITAVYSGDQNFAGGTSAVYDEKVGYYVVTSTADDGSTGTLRDAINQVNAGKYDEIDFNISGKGLQTINLTSALPAITASGVFINGHSENQIQGVTGNSPLIELNGSGAGSSSDGLLLQGANCTLSGLIIEHFYNGIEIQGTGNTVGGASGSRNVISGNSNDGVKIDSSASGNLVEDNYIGVNPSGDAALANSIGIEIAGSNNTVGASFAVAPNEISGNSSDGVLLDSGSSGNQVLGNYIGTNQAGTAAVANKVGIEDAGSSNTLGGSVLGAKNVISGNTSDGVLLDSTATAETMQDNYIGLNEDGNAILANGTNGVEVKGNKNTIGGNSGSNYFVRNFISGNNQDGVSIDSNASGNQVLGNFIGVGVSGTNGLGNVLNGIEIAGSSNSIGGTVSGDTNFLSGNNRDGMLLDSGAIANLIVGNDVGTDYTGKNAVGNSGNGIEIAGNSNTIGGTSSAARNILSGNSADGLRIDSGASGNQALGNSIGLNFLGSVLANGVNGVNLAGTNNTLGGTVSAARNYISANGSDGVLLASSASSNLVLGNYIGLNASGGAAGNSGNGIEIAGSGNTIGGTAQAASNVLSANSKDGIRIDSGASGNQVQGNYIGTNATGSTALANSVGIEDAGSNNTLGGSVLGARNIISGNSGDGILLDSSATAETVQGNYIGLNQKGNAVLADGGNGIEVQGTSNTIGGNSGSNYYTRNFISGNGNDGVRIDSGASGNVVQGNFIGLDITGTHGVGNVANGIEIAGNSNTIGGTVSGLGNTISGNTGDGVLLDSTASANVLAGNDIGTDYTGKNALGNSGNGIEVSGANNTLGGTTAGAGNVIGANSNNGVQIDSGVSGTLVQGNYIGTNAAGGSLGNGSNGVSITGNNNTIGGNAYRAANTIANNSGDGVLVNGGTGNSLLRNSIVGNSGLGISLTNGGNNNVAAPSVTSASYSGGTLTVDVTYDAPIANVSYAIELFASPSSDEGAVYLGTVTLTPKSTGTQSFTYKTATTVVTSNPIITATITDSSGDTSEFSNSVTS